MPEPHDQRLRTPARLGARVRAGTPVDAIVEGAPDAVVTVDAEGRVNRWNRRAEVLFGWPREEAIGRHARDLIVPPETREAHQAGLRRALLDAGRVPLDGEAVEVEAQRRDGSRVPVELTVARLDGPQDVAFIAFIRDITARRRAEDELREARDTFRLAFHASPMGIVLFSLDFRWLEVNPALCAMLGYTEEELRRQAFDMLVHPEDRPVAVTSAARLRSGATSSVRNERRYLRADGSVLWADVTTSALTDASGAPRCFLGQMLDISDHKAAEAELVASERRLAEAQAIGRVGSWEWDAANDTVTWSDEMLAIFGLDRSSAPQSQAAYIARVHPEDRAGVAGAMEVSPVRRDYRIVRPDGEVRWVHGTREIVSAPGEPMRIAGTIQDITELKRAIDELRRSNAELEQYANAVSHDLASPLTTIAGFASMLDHRYGSELPEEARSWLAAIGRGTDRMRTMLDAMLDYSRTQRGERTVEVVPLGELMAEVLDDLRAQIATSGALVEVQELPRVRGERALLRQVLLNLVGNALKFVRPGEPPRVWVDAVAEEPTWVVTVADAGIGIPPERAERAFGLFARLTSDYPGTGMGLALCRKIVERHDGHIWIEPSPAGGTAVRFALPA